MTPEELKAKLAEMMALPAETPDKNQSVLYLN